jgi:RHS repeat-associated protein
MHVRRCRYSSGNSTIITRFEYDLDDNLTALIDPVGNRTDFAYDQRGRNVRETQQVGVVYTNDFESAAGPEWSINRLDRTPVGNRGFLGQFTNETETLTLTGLDPHEAVTVEFDLFILRSWGGNTNSFGPDVWESRVSGGPTLLHTTFSNAPNLPPFDRQAYPAMFPGGDFLAFTGAAEMNSLGYTFCNFLACGPADSVYHLTFTFAHADPSLVLEFRGIGLQAPADESWGLDNIQVRLGNASTEYTYDFADNLAQKTDRNGRVTQFAYDDLDRLITETWVGGGNVIQYAYDKASNLASAMDNFSSLAFSYDARDRVRTVDNADTPSVPNVVLTYSYDARGNVLSTGDAVSGSPAGLNSYAYDALDRMTQITQSGTGVAPKRVDFNYNPLGQFAGIDRFSDLAGTQAVVNSNFEYDTLNRLTALTHSNPANPTPLNFFNFVYDSASRITSITDIDGPTSYEYDDRDQLTAANHADPANPDENYLYDANGNRISSHLHGTGYVTDSHNRLTSDGTFNYEYDMEGNMTLRTEIATSATREFQWDFRNRLAAVIDRDTMGGETQRVEFTYDTFNRRISKTVTAAGNSTTRHFVYDGIDVLLEFLDPDSSGPGPSTLDSRLLHGPAVDQVLAQEDGVGTVLWHITDHLGTVRNLVDNTGTVANHLTYDSYGNVIAESKPAVDSRYLYTGREFDAETGLYYYRARYYDARAGRFVGEDPIGFARRDTNLYRYVGNEPTFWGDPLGLSPADTAALGEHVGAGLADYMRQNSSPADVLPSGNPTGWLRNFLDLPGALRREGKPRGCVLMQRKVRELVDEYLKKHNLQGKFLVNNIVVGDVWPGGPLEHHAVEVYDRSSGEHLVFDAFGSSPSHAAEGGFVQSYESWANDLGTQYLSYYGPIMPE